MSYQLDPAGHGTQTWNFSTTAASTGVRNLKYDYTGFHAYFQVRAFLDGFVTHNGVTTYTPLVNAGPTNCCSSPSGGFTYNGDVALNVQTGDTYGFTFGGSNSDSNNDLQGTLTISAQQEQAITFTSAPPSPAVYGDSYTPTATGGGSGNPVVFSIDSSSDVGACSLSGGAVDFTGVGSCMVDANQAGNLDYLAAPQVQQSFTIGQAPQAVAFTSTQPSPALVGGSYPPAATGGASGSPVVFSIDSSSTSGACSLTGRTVSFTAGGTCVIDANQAGNTDYSAAPQVQQSISIGYTTSGFLSPVRNAPAVNDGKAGRTYPLKWQLLDANGQSVSTLSAIQSVQAESATCGSFSGVTSTLDTAAVTGGTSPRYDSTSNQYVYNWATPGTGCYTIIVTLAGGQVLTADFNLS
jgi:hypothetical protein